MGVFLSGTGNNSIYDNKIKDTQSGIVLYNINNNIYDNEISLGKNGIVFEPGKASNQSGDLASTTNVISPVEDYQSHLVDLVDSNNIFEVENPYVHKEEKMNNTSQIDQTNNVTTLT
jgi:parallel beta-helix repeat protein